MRPKLWHAFFLSVFVFANAAASQTNSPPRLNPVYRLKAINGKQRFITKQEYDFSKLQPQIEETAFLAVVTNYWHPGLVPIFSVEKSNRFELRRRPARGLENSSDPLFFGLPLPEDAAASKLAGAWDCRATRGGGTREFFTWELTLEGDQIAGRFDQSTDFRYGQIAGGTFRTNRFELNIYYINDQYFVTGDWIGGTLKGIWRRADDSENGTWQATREPVRLPAATNTVALYEWRHPPTSARQYRLDNEKPGNDWQRSPLPLCLVWRVGDTSRTNHVNQSSRRLESGERTR